MRKLIVACAVVAFGWVAVTLTTGAAEDEKPKYTIKEVMKAVHAKGKLKDKVVAGTASEEEKKQLVAYYEALAGNKPPKGDAESWKKGTADLLAAAKEALEGKEGAGEKLKAASNCAACHMAHKGA
jgi:hypothetical protein